MPAPEVTDHDPLRGGLAWIHELDLAQILAAIGATQLGEAGDEDAGAEEAAAMEAAAEAGTPTRDLTGVIADQLPPGPALAACLSGADPAALSEWDLPGRRRGVPPPGGVGAGRGTRRGRGDRLPHRGA